MKYSAFNKRKINRGKTEKEKYFFRKILLTKKISDIDF